MDSQHFSLSLSLERCNPGKLELQLKCHTTLISLLNFWQSGRWNCQDLNWTNNKIPSTFRTGTLLLLLLLLQNKITTSSLCHHKQWAYYFLYSLLPFSSSHQFPFAHKFLHQVCFFFFFFSSSDQFLTTSWCWVGVRTGTKPPPVMILFLKFINKCWGGYPLWIWPAGPSFFFFFSFFFFHTGNLINGIKYYFYTKKNSYQSGTGIRFKADFCSVIRQL